ALPSDSDQITHVLNRIAYGPRPDDIERVRQMGIRQYIEQQLHPEKIDDVRTEQKLRDFASLRLSIAQVLTRYPHPQKIDRPLGLLKPGGQANAFAAGQNPTDQAASRQKVQAYLRENDMRPPQQLLQELIGQKLVRGVESERQLQEVMTD